MDQKQHKLAMRIGNINSTQIRNYLLNLHPLILIILITINLTIPAYGALLYFWQYEYYNPIFWIFIPDSNSFAILFGIFLIVTFGLKKNVQILNIVTFIGLVKVCFGYYMLFILIPSYFDVVSFLAHSFELLEGLMILPFIKSDFKNYLVASMILSLDWFLDFFNPFFIYPTMPLYQQHEVYNPVGTKPFMVQFFLLFTVIIFGLLILIRLRFWIKESNKVKWIENINLD